MIHKRHSLHEIWRVEEKQHPSFLLMRQVEARLSDIFIAHFCLSSLTSLVLRSSQVWNNFTCPQILLEFLPLVCHIVFSTMMKGDCVLWNTHIFSSGSIEKWRTDTDSGLSLCIPNYSSHSLHSSILPSDSLSVDLRLLNQMQRQQPHWDGLTPTTHVRSNLCNRYLYTQTHTQNIVIIFVSIYVYTWASLMAQTVKNLPAMWETWVWSLGLEDPLAKAMVTHSIPLAWKIPWTRSLVGCSPWGHEESDMTEQLHFHFSLSCIGEGYGNPLQCSCLENPRDRGAWWAAVYGVAQSQTRFKWLSSSSSSQHSCLENSMDRGAWQAVVHGVAKNLTLLSN